MVRFSSYKVPQRRRRQGKTDYTLRLKLLKSSKPRLVVRKYNNGISCQVVKFGENGDHTIASSHSNELKKLGWDKGGNIPSAYLTGLLCGVRAKSKVKEAVFDLGLNTSTKGSRLYAALKGFSESVNVPHSNEIVPDDKRTSGEHIPGGKPKNFQEVKEKILGMQP